MADIPLPRSKHFYQRWWFWLLVIIFVVIVGGIAYGTSRVAQKRRASLDYLQESVTVTRRSLQKTIATSGLIVPDGVAHLAAAVPGKVKTILTVGDLVEEGDVLVTTDAVVGKELKAPFDGRILGVNTVVGDMAVPGQPVITVGYRTSHIEFFASDTDVLQLHPGQKVSMTVPAYHHGREKFEGEVYFVDIQKTTNSLAAPSPSSSTQTGYRVKILPQNVPAEVLNIIGLSVDATVLAADRLNVLSLERGAVQYDDNDNTFVYRVPIVDDALLQRAAATEDVTQLLEKKEITLGFEGDDYVEVTSGLAENENVLLYIPERSSSFF